MSTLLFLATSIWLFVTLLNHTDLAGGPSLVVGLAGGAFVGATWKFFLKLFIGLALAAVALFFLAEVFG